MASRILAATTVVGFAMSLWLYRENRALRAARDEPVAPAAAAPSPAVKAPDPWTTAARARKVEVRPGPAPALPEPKEESRMERRARRSEEFAAMFGRANGETEDEYRARMIPLIKAGLAIPRSRVEDMRKQAEALAHVTPQQSAQLDQAFDKVYGDVLDYTNKAITDGQLSPYERNVAGWLEYAGGLGGILNDANGQIGKILDPAQVKAMSDGGFEWGEYLGLEAPWEKLQPPPAR